jgi:ATPase subunit of ABC transporter with duplicated ATPase domains
MIRFDRVTVPVRKKILLSNISFSLAAREKAVLRGRSGSGKTTVLKSLLGRCLQDQPEDSLARGGSVWLVEDRRRSAQGEGADVFHLRRL